MKPSTRQRFVAVRFDYPDVDIETNKGQVLIEPSVIGGMGRKMNDKPMLAMPEDIKKLILLKENLKEEKKPLE